MGRSTFAAVLKNEMMMTLLNVALTPYSSLIIGAILGLALSCSVFIWVFNRRAQEWAHYYKEQNAQNNMKSDENK